MRAARARDPHPRARTGGLVDQAYIHLTSARHTTYSLARALGVSVATAFRLIGELRRRGTLVESLKRGREWYFEVSGASDLERVWREDALIRNVGFIKGHRRRPGQSEDEVVYSRS